MGMATTTGLILLVMNQSFLGVKFIPAGGRSNCRYWYVWYWLVHNVGGSMDLS